MNNENEFDGLPVRLQLGIDMYYGRLVRVMHRNQLAWQNRDQLPQPHVIIDVAGVEYTAQLNAPPALQSSLIPAPARRLIVRLRDGSEPFTDLYNLHSSSNGNTHQQGPVGSLVVVKTESGDDLSGTLSRH